MQSKCRALLYWIMGVFPAIGFCQAGAPEVAASAMAADAAADNATQAQAGAPVPYPQNVPVPQAEEASAAQAEPAVKNRIMEEIVVTAQKREENLQDVPISIQAFSADALAARGINNPTDLKQITPALVYDELVGYAVIYMRGVGADLLTPTAEPSVATYIDGVYFPFNHGLAKDFTPVQRVEILKGPQGTLFGRNATGGAINIVTVQPGEQWKALAEGGIGSYMERRAKGYVSGPVWGGLSFSLAGLYTKQDPYYTLAPTSPRTYLDPNESRGLNPRLRWELTDELTLSAAAYITHFFGTGTVINSQLKPTPLGLLAASQQTGPRETAYNEPGTLKAKTDVYSGQVEYKPELLDIKLIGSYQDNVTDTRWDYDNGPLPLLYFYPTNQYFKATTGELQFISKDSTPFSDYLEWVAGLYYYKADAGIDPIFVGAFNFNSPGLLTGLVGPVVSRLGELGIPLPASAANLMLRGGLLVNSWAGYTQVTYKASDQLRLTLGARYQAEERHLNKSTVGVVPNGYDTSSEIRIFDFLANNQYKTHHNDVSPRAVIDYKLEDDDLLYLSFGQAFKSATFNLVNVYKQPNLVRPEKTTAYEAGFKGSFFDQSLRFNAAAFYNEVKDIQTMVLSVASGGLINIVNAAKARIYGAEFDSTWQPLPSALPGLVMTASGSYLNGRYTSFPEGAGFDPTTGLAFGAAAPLPPRDFSGNQTVRTPKLTGTAGLAYTFDAWGGPLELGTDVYLNDGYFFDPQNVVRQPRYYLWNARTSYLYEAWNLRASLNVSNITNQLYYVNIFPNDFGQAGTGGPPRMVGFRLEWRY